MKAKYTGDAGRYYPEFGISPEPGKTYDIPKDPEDGNWAVTPDSAAKAAKETK